MEKIRFRALGPIELHAADGTVATAVLAQPKRLALLAYLALAGDEGFRRRDELLGMFWPDKPDDRARLALRVSLSFLRTSLEHSALFDAAGDGIRVSRDVVGTDVDEFHRLLRSGDVAGASRWYRGELLAGFHLSNNAPFAHWVDMERSVLRRTAWLAAQTEADRLEAERDFGAAFEMASEAARVHPLNEESARSLMRLACLNGDRAGALLHFESFRSRLKDELETEPRDSTLALVESIRDGTVRNAREQVGAPGTSSTWAEPPTPGANPIEDMRVVPASRAAWVVAASIVFLGVAVITRGTDAVPASEVTRPAPPVAITEVTREERQLLLPFEAAAGNTVSAEVLRLGNDLVLSTVLPSGIGDVVAYPSIAGRLEDQTRIDMTAAADTAAAARIIAGEVELQDDDIVIRVSILDAATLVTREVLQPVFGSSEEPLGAFRDAAERILAALAHEYETEWQWPEDRTPPTLEIARMENEAFELFYARRYDDFLELSRRIEEASGDYLPVRIIGHRAAAFWNSQHLGPGRLLKADSIMDYLISQEYRLSGAERQQNAWAATQIKGQPEAEYRAAWDGLVTTPNTGRAYQLMNSALRSHRPALALELVEKRHPGHLMVARFAGWDAGHTTALVHLGRFDELLAEARRAQRLHMGDGRWVRDEVWALAGLGEIEDLDRVIEEADFDETTRFNRPAMYAAAAYALYGEGRHEAARHFAKRALEAAERATDPTVDTRSPRAAALGYLGRWLEAAEVYEELLADDLPPNLRALLYGELGAAYAYAGENERATDVLRRARAFEVEWGGLYIGGLTRWSRARVHVALGEADRALPLLESSVQSGRTFTEPWAEWDPHLLPLHGNPRYDTLVAHRLR